MKVIIVSCVFPPEPVISSSTSADIARMVLEKGNNLRVITTFPNRPQGRIYSGYRRMLFSNQKSDDGYTITRCFSTVSSKSDMWSRFFENISFGLSSGLAVFFSLERPDVIYANTWPIFAQGILAMVCWLRNIPLVLSVQDLYPESLYVQKRGVGGASGLFRLLHYLDALITRNCAAIIVISEPFKRVYLENRGVSGKKIHVIPNWIDERLLDVFLGNFDIRAQHQIPQEAFLIVYGGNVSVASGIDTIVEALEDLLKHKEIYFLVAGDGSLLPECKKISAQKKISRVKFHTPWPTNETWDVLKSADLLLLPTQGDQALVSVPSKLLSYMLAGKPILAIVSEESEIANIIQISGAGWVSSPEAISQLPQSILKISSLPQDERDRYGARGQEYVKQHYSKNLNAKKVVDLLTQKSN